MLVEPAPPSLPSPPPPSSSFATQRNNFFNSLRLPMAISPLSPTFNIALNSTFSPATPVFDADSHKPAKSDVPTLGGRENDFPPELVSIQPRTSKGRKRSSTVSVPEYNTRFNSELDSSQHRAVLAAGDTVVGRRRRVRPRVVKHTASSTSLRSDSKVQAAELEPFSYPSLVPVPALPESFSIPDDTDTLFVVVPREHERQRTTSTAMHRKEAGWSGEWSGNVQSMEDVVRGLRDLRFK